MRLHSIFEHMVILNQDDMYVAVESVLADIEYLTDADPDRQYPNSVLICFYSLIAMTCLYGGMQSMKETMYVQSASTPEGARVNTSPVNKIKLFTASMTAVLTILLAQTLLLLLYLNYVIKIDFPANMGFILVLCATGVLTGLLGGALVGVLGKGSVAVKTGIIIAYTMLMCVLGGMMSPDIKYIIDKNVPMISKLNPVALISDGFYSLHYYTGYTEFIMNLLMLWALNLIALIVIYSVIRKKDSDRIKFREVV